MEVHYVPMLDTGIGREMGYESDAAFLEAENARRAEMDPEVRLTLEQHDRDVARAFLLGE